jgi:hypothetical protein
MSSVLRGSQLIESCPPSISYDRQVQAASAAFDQQMYSIIDDTGQVVIIPNIASLADPNLIDILAWQFAVDNYDTTQSLEFRKNLVQQSILWHRTKGTVALIQEILDTYWPGGATLQEWFEYKAPAADVSVASFATSNVDISGNIFNISGHGLIDGDLITFTLGTTLPAPLAVGIYYAVVDATTNTFQVAATIGGTAIDLTSVGAGMNNVLKHAPGSFPPNYPSAGWNGRYLFRIVVNSTVITTDDEAAVLDLVNRYKPVSRWCEAFIESEPSSGECYAAAYAQFFNYRQSAAAFIR